MYTEDPKFLACSCPYTSLFLIITTRKLATRPSESLFEIKGPNYLSFPDGCRGFWQEARASQNCHWHSARSWRRCPCPLSFSQLRTKKGTSEILHEKNLGQPLLLPAALYFCLLGPQTCYYQGSSHMDLSSREEGKERNSICLEKHLYFFFLSVSPVWT